MLSIESSISGVGSVAFDSQSIDELIEPIKISLADKSTEHSAKEKFVTVTHAERFD